MSTPDPVNSGLKLFGELLEEFGELFLYHAGRTY